MTIEEAVTREKEKAIICEEKAAVHNIDRDDYYFKKRDYHNEIARLLEQQVWIPIECREANELDRVLCPARLREDAYGNKYMFFGELPKEGESVIVSTIYGVDMVEFTDIHFTGDRDNKYDWTYEVEAWIHAPKKYERCLK